MDILVGAACAVAAPFVVLPGNDQFMQYSNFFFFFFYYLTLLKFVSFLYSTE